MDYENELNILKNNLEKAKNLKYKAEARLEQLNQQEEEITKELKDMGIDPDQLETVISNLTQDINKLFEEANQLLPMELLEKKS